MARKQGTFMMNGTIEPKIDAPLDARLKVQTKADLTASGTFPYKYNGMIVVVESEQKAYMLIGADPTIITNWKAVGEGGGEAGSVELTWEEYQSLSPEEKMNGMTYYIKDGESTIALEDIIDVKLVNPSNGQILKYNAVTKKWENDNESSGGGGSTLTSITYTEPILTLTYEDGSTYNFNVRDSILRVTQLGELANVTDSAIQNTNVLQYDSAIEGYKPYDVVAALTATLNSAKTYTDEEIASAVVADAHYCDAKPTCAYDSVSDKYIVTYVQGGTTLTTDSTTDRFYYKVSDDAYSSSWFVIGDSNVDPIEFTYLLNSVDLDDFLKNTDVVSTYNTSMVDKTKIPNIAALDALMTLVSTALGLKVNTADIIDNLTTQNAKKPLSANQGYILKGLVDGKSEIIQFSVMPEAVSGLANKVYQFVGVSTATYTNGAFYRCSYDSEHDTWFWEACVTPGSVEIDNATIKKNGSDQLYAEKASNSSLGVVTAGDGINIDENGGANVINRLVVTASLPTAKQTLVGSVRLLIGNQSGYHIGGIYQCQASGSNYKWELISYANVDPSVLSDAISNNVEARNILLFG